MKSKLSIKDIAGLYELYIMSLEGKIIINYKFNELNFNAKSKFI
jgi:hypothetical protein